MGYYGVNSNALIGHSLVLENTKYTLEPVVDIVSTVPIRRVFS